MTACAGEVRNKRIWYRHLGGGVAGQSQPGLARRLLWDLGGCQGLWKNLCLESWQ